MTLLQYGAGSSARNDGRHQGPGASLMVISPQLEKYSKFIIKKHNLTFPLLRNEDNQLASQFGLTYTLPDDLVKLYSQFEITWPDLMATI